jgi:hypothetical protein
VRVYPCVPPLLSAFYIFFVFPVRVLALPQHTPCDTPPASLFHVGVATTRLPIAGGAAVADGIRRARGRRAPDRRSSAAFSFLSFRVAKLVFFSQ